MPSADTIFLGEIPPPPLLVLLPEALARRSASSMASTSFVSTRDLTSGATPLCVTLRRLNGVCIDTGGNSSARTLARRQRKNERPLVFVKVNSLGFRLRSCY